MREIEFRGKDIETGEWKYGFYSQFHNRPNIDEPNIHQIFELLEENSSPIILGNTAIGGLWFTINENTLGQFTGLKDKNGTKIYEGDVVKVIGMIGKVISQCGSFGICFDDCVDYEKLDKFTQKRVGNNFSGGCCDNFISIYEIWWNLNNLDDYLYEVEVVGNIYDNPELLESL